MNEVMLEEGDEEPQAHVSGKRERHSTIVKNIIFSVAKHALPIAC